MIGWIVDQGSDLDDLVTAASGDGRSAEAAQRVLEEQPKLTNYETVFWNIFAQLNTTRSVGMSSGPIPITAIWQWADRNRLSQLQNDILERVIRAMDTAWLQATARKREQEAK